MMKGMQIEQTVKHEKRVFLSWVCKKPGYRVSHFCHPQWKTIIIILFILHPTYFDISNGLNDVYSSFSVRFSNIFIFCLMSPCLVQRENENFWKRDRELVHISVLFLLVQFPTLKSPSKHTSPSFLWQRYGIFIVTYLGFIHILIENCASSFFTVNYVAKGNLQFNAEVVESSQTNSFPIPKLCCGF